MQHLTKLLTGLILASSLLMSCDKKDDGDKNDDANKVTKNFLKVGDIEYNLSAGILENYGADDDTSWYYGYSTDLLLHSEGLIVETDEENEYSLVGKGHGIYFEMYSTTGNTLDNVKYAFTSDEPCSIGTFGYGAYVINYDSEVDESGDQAEFASGTVIISKSGSEYSVTIDCTGFNGKKVTGFYKGTLRYFDSSALNKSASLKSTKL